MCVSYEIRQKIQKLAFPDGVIWDKENKIPRTVSENSVLKLFRCISSAYVGGEDAEGHKKTGKTADFSGLVDYTDEFSNFFEDLLRLDRFAQSAEDELNRNVSEEEESRDDL